MLTMATRLGVFRPGDGVQLAFQTGYASLKGTEVVDGRYHVVVGPPNKEVADFLKWQFVEMFYHKDADRYIDALFLGKYEWACDELQRTLQHVNADMVPRTGTSVLETGGWWSLTVMMLVCCGVVFECDVVVCVLCCASAHCRGRRQVLCRSRCSTVTRSDAVPDWSRI